VNGFLVGAVVWAVLIVAVLWLYHLSRQRDRRIEAQQRDSGGHAHLLPRKDSRLPRKDSRP
jgi:cell division protein FtsN